VRELDLKLVKAVDTHLHADHISGLGALRDKTQCITVMGEQTKADVVSMRLAFGERSAMAVQAAQDARLSSACHLEGGLAAWKAGGGPIEQ
jgi:glyoxylase-like metal-dependent hydrolase (beta-lactamase superfamily II)